MKFVVTTSLLISTDAVNCCNAMLLRWNDDFYLVHWWKLFTMSVLSISGGMKLLGSCESATLPCRSPCVPVHFLAGSCKKSNYSCTAGTWTRSLWEFLGAETVKLQQFVISDPDELYHRSRVATDSTGWDKQACWHKTFHDVTVTSRLTKNV